MKKLNIIGLGYIGLPLATLLAIKGYDVLGVDISQKVVETINAGNIHIVEPDLDIVLKFVVDSKKLAASTTIKPADIHIIAVPTPFKEKHAPDLSYVIAATHNLCAVLKAGDLVILESTSPVGTTDQIADIIRANCPDIFSTIHVAHSPERVIPGKILRELVENDRVIGGVTPQATEIAVAFYKTFVQGEVIPTNARTAEMCKLAENTFRDINIAYANELSLVCEKLGVNVWELIRLANHHPRVNILQPGPGVGGHCIAVDPWFLVNACPREAKLIHQARLVNDAKPAWVVEKLTTLIQQFEKKPVIVFLGAAFKPNVDDFRESPALEIIRAMQTKNIAEVKVVEPYANDLTDIALIGLEEGLASADILVPLVKHDAFLQIATQHQLPDSIFDAVGLFQGVMRDASATALATGASGV